MGNAMFRNPIICPISAIVNPELKYNLCLPANTQSSMDRDHYGEQRLHCLILRQFCSLED